MEFSRRGQRSENQGRQNYGDWEQGEQERYRGQGDGYQGGYGGSTGEYGRQAGYRQVNYPQSELESDYSSDREYTREESEFRPEQRRHEGSARSWMGGGESHYRDDRERGSAGDGYDEGSSYRSNSRQGQMRGPGDSTWQGSRDLPSYMSGYTRPQGMGQRDREGSMENFSRQDYAGGRKSFAGRGPKGYRRADERITEDINEQLTQDHDVDATNISVEVKNGEVTLNGRVTDRESKRRAEEIAENFSGVNEVQNQLRVHREDSQENPNESQREKTSEEKKSKPH
jgi:osmotically-inducible protein OsmY